MRRTREARALRGTRAWSRCRRRSGRNRRRAGAACPEIEPCWNPPRADHSALAAVIAPDRPAGQRMRYACLAQHPGGEGIAVGARPVAVAMTEGIGVRRFEDLLYR